MTIFHRAPPRRRWRHAALAGSAVAVGIALAWLNRSEPPPTPAPFAGEVVAPTARLAAPPAAADTTCDARCVATRVIVPAGAACTLAVEELAGFGVRWLVDAPQARFDTYGWLSNSQGTLTLAGGRAEFRNAAGAYTPVDYDCDFDPARLAVLAARARPRASPP
jgi:hypothetical protein